MKKQLTAYELLEMFLSDSAFHSIGEVTFENEQIIVLWKTHYTSSNDLVERSNCKTVRAYVGSFLHEKTETILRDGNFLYFAKNATIPNLNTLYRLAEAIEEMYANNVFDQEDYSELEHVEREKAIDNWIKSGDLYPLNEIFQYSKTLLAAAVSRILQDNFDGKYGELISDAEEEFPFTINSENLRQAFYTTFRASLGLGDRNDS